MSSQSSSIPVKVQQIRRTGQPLDSANREVARAEWDHPSPDPSLLRVKNPLGSIRRTIPLSILKEVLMTLASFLNVVTIWIRAMTTAQSHQYSRATTLHQWTRSLITAKRQSKRRMDRMKVRSKASNSRRNSWCNSRWRKCKKRLVLTKNRVLISKTSTRSCSGLSFRWRETMISWSKISITSFKVVTLTRLRNKVNITSLQLMPQISLKLHT